ncbi:PREDICTED: uncharacterized protein LOC108558408 [Nicrophorus vespilloides]|uniref:Uncharacterized protein LOC108558408 n=1 Tax=Nicrophorus vespilloides TaxID=110193 RepID=A0ABM1M8A5_NICVS|nr:PREDICTED: uncharacterized protein LOC108558408 [Nicrophorus vespilloides]
MDQFVTTYRKDFLWPYVRSFGLKPDNGPQFGGHGDMCACQCSQEDEQKLLGPNVLEQDAYQKLGPSAPLMDPKLYPARVGPAPENDTQRFNQPNVFLEKLRMKYPFLYEVLRTTAPDDLISRINRDRLRTTYEVDYCHLNEYPSAPYDELIRAAGLKGGPVCSEPVRLPGDPCRPNQKPIAFRPGALPNATKIDKISNSTKCGAVGGGGGSGGAGGFGSSGGSGGQNSSGAPGIGGAISMGTTEYQDAISKLGELIIRDKIHIKKRNRGILSWNPFNKEHVNGDDSLNKWGKMIYRDQKHSHGARSSGRTALSRK